MISKARAMGESAARTFLQAALPAFGAALYAADGAVGKAVLLGALTAAAAAGLAAVARVLKPIQTDVPGVGVAGANQPRFPSPAPTRHEPEKRGGYSSGTTSASQFPPPSSGIRRPPGEGDSPGRRTAE